MFRATPSHLANGGLVVQHTPITAPRTFLHAAVARWRGCRRFGKQALYTNRVAWAITHMTQAGLLNRPERGRYALSERGTKVLQEHPEGVDLHVLQQFPSIGTSGLARARKAR